MARDDTRTKLPRKLSLDLWDCWDDHRAAFKSLVDELSDECPDFIIKSKNRYSAF